MSAQRSDVELLLDAAVAVGAATTRVVAAVVKPVVRIAWRPPVLPRSYSPQAVVERLAVRGHPEREELALALADALRVVVPEVLDTVLDQVDLTKLVIDRVDIDAVVAHADVDAVVARLDLIDLAETIIDGVDLPGIIRDSTGSIASEGIRGVRMQTIDADERVNRLVDRVLLRRQARATAAPVPEQRDPGNGDGSGEHP